MNPVNQKLNSLIGHIQELLERHLDLIEENKTLKVRNRKLEEELDQRKRQLGELDHRLKVLKLARGSDVSDDKAELKRKINEYIREIDKVLAMLNT
jgi:regulator of replication initiation timing